MENNLAKNYRPKDFEDRIYAQWEESGAFAPDANAPKDPFTVMMPPPNITGQLHMGHALDQSLQDVLIRYKRMQGHETLWLPGTDHASIATEVKVVDKLREEEGLSKEDIGREAFLERAWEWKRQYGGRINEQIRRLGSSCDWKRERFTMDEGCNRAVKEHFINLYNKGLIYKGARLINWCPVCGSALSDIEVEHVDHNGSYWYFRYPGADGSEGIVVATSRPETMFADTAVAVHPSDERYKDLVGKKVILPLVGREIPVIADEYPDPEKGTGAVKITPSADPNDFEVGLRHGLEMIECIDEKAKMTAAAGKYEGMDRYECRKAWVADLEAAQHHIHFQFFKFEDDETGRKAEEILARKSEEGVEVRLQIDDLANLTRRRFYRRMAERGVQVRPFYRVRLLLSSETNYRNHRKNVVIDGRVGYTGGMNIAKRYAGGGKSGTWRDTHIRVAGPVVAEMQTAFLVDWKFSTKQLLDDPIYYPRIPAAGSLMLQVATSGPMGEYRVIMQGLLRMLSESREYVYIQTPYFVPNEAMVTALRNAALSGVDVRLMLPRRGDVNFIVTLAGRSYVSDVVSAGVKVYLYEPGFLHAKTIVADDGVVSIGSANLDIRSFEQDFEINAFIYDRTLARKMRAQFLEDQHACRFVDASAWLSRPATVRFWESVARLFSPLL